MAKVMISLPDDLLERIDGLARAKGKTRSGLLQDLARHELSVSDAERLARVEALLGEPGSFDGRATEWIRKDRDSR